MLMGKNVERQTSQDSGKTLRANDVQADIRSNIEQFEQHGDSLNQVNEKMSMNK